MRYLLSLTIGLFALFLSCKKETRPAPTDPETLDKVWMKMGIPDQQRGISAIYGNIDDTLVVAAMYKIYITTDRGASWELVHEAHVGISGFSIVNGELCALSALSLTGDYEWAMHPFLYSADGGKTWSHEGRFDYTVYDEVRRIRDYVEGDDGIAFRIDNNLKPMDSQGTSFLHGPNRLFKNQKENETPVYFPFKRYLNYLYIDENGRLYVGADGSRFEGADEQFVYSAADSALIYISREPMDQSFTD